MNEKIYKYRLHSQTEELDIPRDAEILCAQNLRGSMCLWAKVDADDPTVKRRFHVFGTGESIPSDMKLKYIGTVQMESGYLVWHIFEELKF